MSSAEAWWQHGGATALKGDADVDALIEAMITAGIEHSVASVSPLDHDGQSAGLDGAELRIAVLGDRGALQYGGDVDEQSGTWYAAGTVADRDPLEYFYMGHDEQWPADSVVSVEVVRAALKEFLTSGGERPTGLEWKAWS